MAGDTLVRRIDILATFLGTLLMVLLGWVPIVGAFVSGFVAGAIVKTKWSGFYISIAAGAIGAGILYYLWNYTTAVLLRAIQAGAYGPGIAHVESFMLSLGPAVVYPVAFAVVVLGGVLGGSFVEHVCKESYERGEFVGRNLERMKHARRRRR